MSEKHFFASNADLEKARQLSEIFRRGGIHVKAIGNEVLAAIDEEGLPESAYDRLARMCHNRNVDMRRNVAVAREISIALFGRVIEYSR